MKYYGQFNPPLDQLLHERYFRSANGGVFIECGATDGVSESTCKFFEESMGWTGINIEPVPYFFQKLELNRPHSTNLNLALSDEQGTASFSHAIHPVHGWHFGNGSLKHSSQHMDDLIQQGCDFVQFQVNTLNYKDLVETLVGKGLLPRLDLMVLDVEGHELQVIKGMRNALVFPRVLCVESTISDADTLRHELEDLGYQFDVKMHNNSVFVRNCSDPIIPIKKPTIAVCACLRNSSDFVDYYRSVLCNQIGVGSNFNLLFSFVEGDSSDDTLERLRAWEAEDSRVTITQKDVEPISDFEDRVRKWASLGNTAIEGLADKDFDYLLWCECDLCIPADLIQMLLEADKDIVAPAIFLGGQFYDTWGFRGTDGKKFNNTHPIHPSYQPFSLFPVNSVGSVVMFRRAVFDFGIRFRGTYENGLLVGMCNDAREQGFKVYCDSRVAVIHPTSLWRRGQYTLGSIEIVGKKISASFISLCREAIQNMLLNSVNPVLLGQPALPSAHPVCQSVATKLERLFIEYNFSILTRLNSESPKRFELVCEIRKANYYVQFRRYLENCTRPFLRKLFHKYR